MPLALAISCVMPSTSLFALTPLYAATPPPNNPENTVAAPTRTKLSVGSLSGSKSDLPNSRAVSAAPPRAALPLAPRTKLRAPDLAIDAPKPIGTAIVKSASGLVIAPINAAK